MNGRRFGLVPPELLLRYSERPRLRGQQILASDDYRFRKNDPLAGIERDCHAEQDRDNKQCDYPGREPDAARFPSPGPRVALRL